VILPPDRDQFIFDTMQRARRAGESTPMAEPTSELERAHTAARMFFKDPRIADLVMQIHATIDQERTGVGAVVLLTVLLGVLKGSPQIARMLAITAIANPMTRESHAALRAFCAACNVELQPEVAPGSATH
jgi:hypothetical protein